MFHKKLSAFAVVLLMAYVACTTHAAVITLDDAVPENDATEQAFAPNDNYGTGSAFFFSLADGPTNADRNSLNDTIAVVQWDLDLAPGESIESVDNATFAIRTQGNTVPDMVFEIRRLTESFDENTTTWNTRPSVDNTLSVSQTTVGDAGTYEWLNFDVSSLLTENGDKQTFGIMIFIASSPISDNANYLMSSEISNANNRPYLDATFNTVIPEPGALTLLGAGLCFIGSRTQRWRHK